jgi:ketosteroid isomerase-like protein
MRPTGYEQPFLPAKHSFSVMPQIFSDRESSSGGSARRPVASEPSNGEYYADRDKVFVLGRYSWTMKPSGRSGQSEWLHVWTIRNGKVAAVRSLNDTALLAEAWRG